MRNSSILYSTYRSLINIGYNHLSATALAGAMFADNVRSGGRWDYKSFLGFHTKYWVNLRGYSDMLTGEQIGNMHYGVVGRVLFSRTRLRSYAGVYQIVRGNSCITFFSSYFDDPSDMLDINRGINFNATWLLPKSPLRL
ncbi:MAG: polymorphic toxin type 44 domain-containing protein [Alkaliphilus sp.]